jgi:SAM-dependent methyltransferase
MQRFATVTDRATVLDWGCGQGGLVEALRTIGYDAYGCDIWAGPAPASGSHTAAPRNAPYLLPISTEPYRLPFADCTFDVVLSTSVLEHAQNKSECFAEIHRVLKPGGVAMHLYPGKWYLPSEPHIYVPLVNWFWPYCPRWWLWLWAALGVRNEFQGGLSASEVVLRNARYCRNGLSYWSTRRYARLANAVFGNCEWPMDFYIEHADGGMARLARRALGRRLGELLSREFRMAFLLTRRLPADPTDRCASPC